MALFAQHGYGKSDKIERGLNNGNLTGVILSPRDEKPERMSEYIRSLRVNYPAAHILFDPQFYASTITPVKDGCLSNYPYYSSGLVRSHFITPSDLTKYVRETIDYQVNLGVTRLISPTVIFDDFRDPWSQISLSLASESKQYYSTLGNDVPPLLISIAFNENALRGIEALNEFLDILSLTDAAGFYIIVRRNTNQYSSQIDPQIMENLLYLAYILSEINGYEVVFGYTDYISVPLHAVGISASSCGWFNGLRQFSLSRFQPSTGGRAPRPRYSTEALLNTILIIPELDTINALGLINSVAANTRYDLALKANPANAAWPADISCLHHWDVLDRCINNVVSNNGVSQRLNAVERVLAQAQGVYAELDRNGIVFELSSGSSHIRQWQRAITNFRNIARV